MDRESRALAGGGLAAKNSHLSATNVIAAGFSP